MKKAYLKPECNCVQLCPVGMLAESGVTGGGDGINIGGGETDVDGSMDPCSNWERSFDF